MAVVLRVQKALAAPWPFKRPEFPAFSQASSAPKEPPPQKVPYKPNPVTGRPLVIESVANGQDEIIVAPGPGGKNIVHVRREAEKHALDGTKPPVRSASVQTFIQDKGNIVPLTLAYVARNGRLELQPGSAAGLRYDGTTSDFLAMTESVRAAVRFASDRSATLIDQPVAERLGKDNGLAYIKTPVSETRMEFNGLGANVSARYYSPAFPKEGFAFRFSLPMTGKFATSQAVQSVFNDLKRILPTDFDKSSFNAQRQNQETVRNIAAALVFDTLYNQTSKCKLAYMATNPASESRMEKNVTDCYIAPEDQTAYKVVFGNPGEIRKILAMLPPYRDPSAKAAAAPHAAMEPAPQRTPHTAPPTPAPTIAPSPRAPTEKGAWNIQLGVKGGKITTNPGLHF